MALNRLAITQAIITTKKLKRTKLYLEPEGALVQALALCSRPRDIAKRSQKLLAQMPPAPPKPIEDPT